MLTEGKEAAIAGDDVTRTALESRSQVLVIIKILADARQLPVRDDIG